MEFDILSATPYSLNKAAADQSALAIKKHLKTHTGIIAKVRTFFGNAIKIKDSTTTYYNQKSLTKAIVKIITNNPNLSSKLKSSKKIQDKIAYLVNVHSKSSHRENDLIFNLLSIVKHKQIELENSNHKMDSKIDVLRMLDDIDPNSPPVLQWPTDNNFEEIKSKLKPGDIIFMQNRAKLDLMIDQIIVAGQKVAQSWMKVGTEPAIETYTHVAIYLGEGRIAEASPGFRQHDVRILPLNHKKFELTPGEGYEYRICRLKDTKISNEAAKLAKSYAELKIKNENDELGMPTKLRFSKRSAVLSLLSRSKLNKKRKIKALAEGYLAMTQGSNLGMDSITPKNSKGKNRDFFCSYFVTYCLQMGNTGILIKELIETSKLNPPKLTDMNEREKIKIVNAWAKQVIKDTPYILDGLKISHHPKSLCPQKLRFIVNSHPEQFQDVLRIIPPTKLELGKKPIIVKF